MLLSIGLMGCAAESAPEDTTGSGSSPVPVESRASDDSQDPPAGAAAGTAVLTIGDRAFTAQLDLCSVYDSGAEILLAGPASETRGSAHGFLEGDLLQAGAELNGEFRIDIGADAPHQSTNEFLALGYASGTPVTLTAEGEGYIIRSGAWNEKGDSLGEGSLEFSCS